MNSFLLAIALLVGICRLARPAPSTHLTYTPALFLKPVPQIPITASLFFASHTILWLVKIRYEPISPSAKWDDPPNDNDGCPHLYGNFGTAETDSVERFERTGTTTTEQEWKDVFAASSWLE